jgi:hypothetical protein
VPLLFAFTPQILFEGKPIIGPQIDDEIMGATVLELKVEKGQDFKKGQEIAMLLDGESIKKVIADKEGSIKDFVVSKGQRIESNTIIAETKPSSIMVFSSMFNKHYRMAAAGSRDLTSLLADVCNRRGRAGCCGPGYYHAEGPQ